MNPKDYFRNHPPRNIAGYNIQSADIPGFRFDGHPAISEIRAKMPGLPIHGPENFNTIFQISCTCGSDRYYIIGFEWLNPDFNNTKLLLSPLSLRCVACDKVTDLFDSQIHGYDAELGNGSSTERGKGIKTEYGCPQCDRQALQIYVRYEHSDELLKYNDPKSGEQPQNLYSWFSLVGKCNSCSQYYPVTDFECA